MPDRYQNPAPILRKLDGDPRTLELFYNLLPPPRSAALAADPRLSRLTTLTLHDNRLGDQGLVTLLDSPYLTGLARLSVRKNGIGPDGLRALAAWPGLARIRLLDLAENPLGAGGIAALASSPHLASLHMLSLARCDGPFDGAGLLDLPVLDQLSELDLSGNRLSDRILTVVDWTERGISEVPASDLAIALRRRIGPRLKL